MTKHIRELLIPGNTYSIITDGYVTASSILRSIVGRDVNYSVADNMDSGALFNCTAIDGKDYPNNVRRVMFYDWAHGEATEGLRQRHAVMRDHQQYESAAAFGDDTVIVYVVNGRFDRDFIRTFPASALMVPNHTMTLTKSAHGYTVRVGLKSLHRQDGIPMFNYDYDNGVLKNY